MSKDTLGDRMKANYEDRSRYYLIRRMPVIVRIDGKAFHTFTKGCKKPFDERIMESMKVAAWATGLDMQGCKAIYIQSDEASFLLTDYDRLNSEAWFDYNQQKMVSVTASMMTNYFNNDYQSYFVDVKSMAAFDARAFNIPKEEVINYFLWRAHDWHRNSVSMYARSFFSDSQLHGKKEPDMHEMLHNIGKNWATDLCNWCKNGCFITPHAERSVHYDIEPRFESIDALISPLIQPLEY